MSNKRTDKRPANTLRAVARAGGAQKLPRGKARRKLGDAMTKTAALRRLAQIDTAAALPQGAGI